MRITCAACAARANTREPAAFARGIEEVRLFVTLIRHYPALSALLLGAAAACGFAPLQLWVLTLTCFAGWMWLVHDAPTWKAALWRGWVFGVGHFTINDNWFQHAFDFQDKMPPVLGYVAPLALALYLAVYPMVAAGIAWRWRARRIDLAWVLLFAAAWIATEWVRSWMFTGYAWDPLGVVWVPVQPAAMLARWVGTYGLSGLTVLLAGLLLVGGRRRLGPAIAGLTVVLLLIAQAFSYRDTAPPLTPTTPRVVVVQPNVAQDERGESDGEMMLRRLSALSGRPGSAPRLVVWPEGVVRDFIEDDYPFWVYGDRSPYLIRERMAALLGPRDLLLTGGTALTFDGKGDITAGYNSVFAVTPDARLAARYDKAHLVPYGEYLPMPWLLKPLGLARLVPGDFDFLPGPGPRTLDTPGFGAIGTQLCYEIIFSGQVVDPANRPRLLFNPSNDAWFGSWGPPQHLAQARMRAIEEGLPVVRATPNGISAVIAADGTLLATVPHLRAGAIEAGLPPPADPTLFARAGNLMAGIVALVLVAAALVLRRRAR
ncbi:apolipoprotein N-acyltransferase [Sphingomonas sp. HHU CXW]|uniref:Apolipoprotein N-acyltransferase n=1 Tax=Sphingomonas hominis TaxID=2741495 RepID=A0ABX2JLE5_9SPHN|nr:apolipoprotein N-acyltransferase [Sphingomonas hominis]NTS63927.1 apolipoprotein N-acyltransferase [Sphingomonas hominis]